MSDVSEVALRADSLFEQVLAPLLLGGSVRPVRPIGPVLAAEVAALHGVFGPSNSALGEECARVRARQARALAPIDALGGLGRSEWLMLCALNDFLQVANPHLPGMFGGQRPVRLLHAVEQTLALTPPPVDVRECVARHATFARLLQIVRVDTMVDWWTGSAVFRGEPVPKRLLALPGIRRVKVDEMTVSIESLCEHKSVQTGRYLEVLGRLLRSSPLTDLATAGRDEPAFRWTHELLSLVALPTGAGICRRILGGVGAQADVALERGAKLLEQQRNPAALLATRFLEQRRVHASLSP